MERWSKRLESVRKDVERAFGIVKKRFAILKVPFNYATRERVQNAVHSCIILHNMLLAHDGVTDMGTRGSDWIKGRAQLRARETNGLKRAVLVLGRRARRGPRWEPIPERQKHPRRTTRRASERLPSGVSFGMLSSPTSRTQLRVMRCGG